jgi:hypothetical protein
MSLSTIKAKVETWIGKLTEPIENPDYADYYNGSENELENIFLEIQKVLAQPTNVFNINNHKIRLDSPHNSLESTPIQLSVLLKTIYNTTLQAW